MKFLENSLDAKDMDALREILDGARNSGDTDLIRKVRGVMHRKIKKSKAELENSQVALKRSRIELKRAEQDFNFLRNITVNPIFSAVTETKVPYFLKGLEGLERLDLVHGDTKKLIESSHSFLIQHDWSKVIKAHEFNDIEICLPAEQCCFEFNVNGVHVIYAVTSADVARPFLTAKLFPDGWDWQTHTHKDLSLTELAKLNSIFAKQVVAVCIALDASIAKPHPIRLAQTSEAEKERADNNVRFSTSIVNLARRRGTSAAVNQGMGGERRLHFRRGHWRRYQNFKTWVKWCLVGNPDLGFVDKEYRI